MNAVTSKSFRSRAAVYTLITACVALGTCATVQAGEACAVAPSAHAGNSVTVSYRDLNLATSEGAHVLYARITHAAHAVCGVSDIRDLGAVAASEACQREAIAQAVGTVHSSQLAALLNTRPPQG